ncbi:hypothetical protein Zmor_019125 [Zophobas morio]|jgi:hypothetical protein|uniref:Uncharacterized protein n=1 Tax=Zophobas morio TaxID=2755281 RepID=A0AA38HK43_9CUCU|nr:hypothetical protein Zmor_019125 [Zophobas morio]
MASATLLTTDKKLVDLYLLDVEGGMSWSITALAIFSHEEKSRGAQSSRRGSIDYPPPPLAFASTSLCSFLGAERLPTWQTYHNFHNLDYGGSSSFSPSARKFDSLNISSVTKEEDGTH